MRKLSGGPLGFDRVTAGELLKAAFDVGARLTREGKQFSGADSLARCIAFGAKFYTDTEYMRAKGDAHLASVVEGLAVELAHYVRTGELRQDRIEAACAPIREGVGHA
jgi:hypothetical protein